jgi:hypothetical protein
MDSQFCAWRSEDQPPSAGIHLYQFQHILQECQVRFGFLSVNDRVCAADQFIQVILRRSGAASSHRSPNTAGGAIAPTQGGSEDASRGLFLASHFLNPQDNIPSNTSAAAKMTPLARGEMAFTSKRTASKMQIPIKIYTADFLFVFLLGLRSSSG